MAEVRESGELGASIDEVWKLVGDFAGLLEAMGLTVETEGEGVGQTRTFSLGGSQTVERLEDIDEGAKRLSYSIVEGSLPVTGYLSTMQLADAGAGRTRLDWTGRFEAAPGGGEDQAVAVVKAIYQGGIGFLQGRFGA
jgi:hypothetical protein